MARLNYEEFKEYFKKNIVKILGEEQYTATFEHKSETDESVIDIIRIKEKNTATGLCPGFQVEPFYMDHCDGKPLGDVMLEVIKVLESALDMKLDIDIDMFSEFSKIKKNLIIRPISYTKNKNLLEDYIYRKHDDIATVLYSLVKEDGKDLLTAKLPKSVADKWSLSEDYLWRSAIENTAKLYPPLIAPFEAMMFGEKGLEKIPDDKKFFMNTLISFKLSTSFTNTYYLGIHKGINGSTAVFYPGVLERLSTIFQDDLYLTLTNVCEAMVHPVSKSNLNSVQQAARASANSPFISKTEFLSSNVYMYCRKDKQLKMLT